MTEFLELKKSKKSVLENGTLRNGVDAKREKV